MLVLAASNSYTGNTTVGGGTLQVGDPAALQNSTVVLSTTGGILNLNNTSDTLGGLSGSGNGGLGAEP